MDDVFLGNYFDNGVYVMETYYIAEALRRLALSLWEYYYNKFYYPPDRSFAYILKRIFSYNTATIVVGIICVCSALYRSYHNARFMLIPPVTFLGLIPLWWLSAAVGLSRCDLDYAYWIREAHGLDYATGMASNYFHGYLKLALPAHNGEPGIRERIDLYSAENGVQFAVNQLVILVPDSMFINRVIESKILSKGKPLETIMKQRAGVDRPFKNDVYRINVPINGTFYYVALEGATPMLSFYEAMNFEPSSTWQIKAMKREILIKFFRSLKKLVTECPETEHEVELVLYNSKTIHGRTQDVGEVLLAHIINLWNNSK